MTTAQLEERVYAALINNETIMGLLNNRESSIFHIRAPSIYPDYSILVYSVISDVPILHADNAENVHRVTIRIHIITGENDYAPLYEAVKRVMGELEFTRIQTTLFMDEGGKFIMFTDWITILGEN